MKDVSTKDGRTILFVSHNMTAVKSLCTKGIVLKNGSIDFIGNEKDAVKQYLYGENNEITSMERVWRDDQEKPGNDAVRLRRIEIKPIGKEYIDTDTILLHTGYLMAIKDSKEINLERDYFQERLRKALND